MVIQFNSDKYAAIDAGAHPVRYRCEFTTDLPEELKWIPEVHSMNELEVLVNEVNSGKRSLNN